MIVATLALPASTTEGGPEPQSVRIAGARLRARTAPIKFVAGVIGALVRECGKLEAATLSAAELPGMFDKTHST